MSDKLSESLQRLETELLSFENVRNTLTNATEKINTVKDEWERITKEHQLTAEQVENEWKRISEEHKKAALDTVQEWETITKNHQKTALDVISEWERISKEQQNEWTKRSSEQQKFAMELVATTKDAIEATHLVTGQTKALSESLLPLANAIKEVNFPLRLDKIDMAVSTQASTMASFQSTIDRNFTDFEVSLENVNKNVMGSHNTLNVALLDTRKEIVETRDALSSALENARKLNITLIALVIISILIGIAKYFVK